MKCHKIWSREFIDNHIPKQFINNELKTHRELVLFEKEKNLLPDTQHNVRLLHQQEQLDREMRAIETQMEELQQRLESLEKQRSEINPYQYIQKQPQYKNRIQCPQAECRGFVEDKNNQLLCGICQTTICTNCREIVTSQHHCVPETVKNGGLIG
jgi:predicted nuclease with TOPRIM domain